MLIIMDMLKFIIPGLIIYLVIRLIIIRKNKINLGRELLLFTFSAYIYAFIFIVWVRGSIPSSQLRYNYIPFKTILNYFSFPSVHIAVNNILGNLIITAPLGMYAGFQIRLIKIRNIIPYALTICITIELVQLLLYQLGMGARSIDIDDVILNTAGCIAGYYIAKSLHKRIRSARELKERGRNSHYDRNHES